MPFARKKELNLKKIIKYSIHIMFNDNDLKIGVKNEWLKTFNDRV